MVVRVKDGDICSWGENLSFHKPLAGTAFAGKRIKQVACGNYHSLALSSEGDVYAWGPTGFRRRCHGNVEYDNNMSEYENGNSVEDASEDSGEDENDNNDEDDKGDGQQQTFGHPVKITVGENVKIGQIACGDMTFYALDKNGKVKISFAAVCFSLNSSLKQ